MKILSSLFILLTALCSPSIADLAPVKSNPTQIEILQIADSFATCSAASMVLRIIEDLPANYDEEVYDLSVDFYQAAQYAYHSVLKSEHAQSRLKQEVDGFIIKFEEMLINNPNFVNLKFLDCIQLYPNPKTLVDFIELRLE